MSAVHLFQQEGRKGGLLPAHLNATQINGTELKKKREKQKAYARFFGKHLNLNVSGGIIIPVRNADQKRSWNAII